MYVAPSLLLDSFPIHGWPATHGDKSEAPATRNAYTCSVFEAAVDERPVSTDVEWRRNPSMPEIFISSSAATANVAEKLAADLETKGFQTFMPIRDLQAGADYPQIATRVSRSDGFIVLVESHPKRSTMQEREWLAVLDEASDLRKHKTLIPLLVGEGEPPNFLKNWQVLRLRDDAKRWRHLVDTIARALQSPNKPRFTALPKIDLDRRERRLQLITEAAKQLKSLGS